MKKHNYFCYFFEIGVFFNISYIAKNMCFMLSPILRLKTLM